MRVTQNIIVEYLNRYYTSVIHSKPNTTENIEKHVFRVLVMVTVLTTSNIINVITTTIRMQPLSKRFAKIVGWIDTKTVTWI